MGVHPGRLGIEPSLPPNTPAMSSSDSDREPADAGRILIVEDDEETRSLVTRVLESEGYRVEGAASGESGQRKLENGPYDVVLLDLELPDEHGLDLLSRASERDARAQFVIITGHGSVDSAVRAMRLGAFDYLTKPLRREELLVAIERALDQGALRQEVAQLRRKTRTGVWERVIGASEPMKRTFQRIEQVAPTRVTVLLAGETGTGKELLARGLHDLSPRSDGPFVPVASSALSESLLESELFGHVKGSFTGAETDRHGKIQAAEGGTLFLDEIATIPPSVQVKLLRVLQERTVTPVGADEPIPVDFRLVTATNEDLEEKVEAGEFRKDLYYRIHVFPVRVPPLRERVEDLPLLIEEFRDRFREEHGAEPPRFSEEAVRRMQEYGWPGNVRQLENFVVRRLIEHQGDDVIASAEPGGSESLDTSDSFVARARERGWDLDRLEREYILATLEETGGNKSRAAELLGIDRRTLYRKLDGYG